MNLNHCGLSDFFVYHAWNLIIIFDSLGKLILFNTNLFGHYAVRRGLLSLYSVMYPAMAIAVIYAYTFCAGPNTAFAMLFLYRVQVFTLLAAIACYALDALVFIYDKKLFCTLQLEPKGEKTECDDRNKGFLL